MSRSNPMHHDLSYDYEDFGMDSDALLSKYDVSGHPEYTIAKWRDGPAESHNTNGYWDWVASRIAEDNAAIPSNVVELNPELAGQAIFKNEVPIGATPINDVDTFAMLIDQWHATKMDHGNRLLKIPEGTTIEVEDAKTPGQTIEMDLNGTYLQVFKVGVMTALHLFKDLPFGASIEEASNVPG